MLLCFLPPSVSKAQYPESVFDNQIIGGAGFIKFSGGQVLGTNGTIITQTVSPNWIGKIKTINERYSAAFAWDTTLNKLWQYNRLLPIGKRWTPSQFVQYWNGLGDTQTDTAYKFVVDTTNRQLFVCNKNGCVNVTRDTPITVSNGLNMTGNEIKLGGYLTNSAELIVSPTGKFKLKGLDSGTDKDSLMVIDITGTVKKLNIAELTVNYHKRLHQAQTINYSSGYVVTQDFTLLPPQPITEIIKNNVSVVVFNDLNLTYFVEADMTIVLPELQKYNGSIRFMVAKSTIASSGAPIAFSSLNFQAGVNTSLIKPSIFQNVLSTDVFEAQFFSDTKTWLVQKLN